MGIWVSEKNARWFTFYNFDAQIIAYETASVRADKLIKKWVFHTVISWIKNEADEPWLPAGYETKTSWIYSNIWGVFAIKGLSENL